MRLPRGGWHAGPTIEVRCASGGGSDDLELRGRHGRWCRWLEGSGRGGSVVVGGVAGSDEQA
eukprot:5885763-Pleurochrysis_carterae.AAC.1